MQREVWQEEESTHVDTTQPELDQQQESEQQQVDELTQNQQSTPQPEPNQQPATTQLEFEQLDIRITTPPRAQQQKSTLVDQKTQQQESTSVDTEQQTQRSCMVKQRAQRFPQTKQEPAKKKLRTADQVPQTTQLPHVNPDDTTRIQKGQSSTATVREAVGFSNITPAAHELAAILQCRQNSDC